MFDFHHMSSVNPITNHVSLNLLAARKFSTQSAIHLWQKQTNKCIAIFYHVPLAGSVILLPGILFPCYSYFLTLKKLSYLDI